MKIGIKNILIISTAISISFLSVSFNSKLEKEKPDKKKPIPGTKLFNDTIVHTAHLNFDLKSYWDSLLKYKMELDSEDITTFIPAQLIIDGNKVGKVGVRFKGESSYEPEDDFKKSFKIKLNEYSKKTSYDGIKKFNLNNSYADPTFMREKIYYDLLRDMKCQAPRSAYCKLFINKEYYGLFLLAETIDKEYIKTHFQDTLGDLFNGKPRAYFFWEGDDTLKYRRNYSLKSKVRSNTWSDLKHLIDVINNYNFTLESSRLEFEKIFDINQCLKIWALNNVIVNVDSYNMYYIHNFYLYKNGKTRRYLWLPYDGNYSFATFTDDLTLSGTEQFPLLYYPENKEKRPLLSRLLKDSEYRQRYIYFVQDIINKHFTPENLNPKINTLEKLIKKSVYNDPMKKYSNEEFYENLFISVGDTSNPGDFHPGLKSFIVKRKESVTAQILKLKKLKIIK